VIALLVAPTTESSQPTMVSDTIVIPNMRLVPLDAAEVELVEVPDWTVTAEQLDGKNPSRTSSIGHTTDTI
jgi:hypothetical protein